MRTEHRSDGVTTYVYRPDDRTVASMCEIRQSVERVEAMCRDILTALNLLTDLLPEQEAHGNERSAESGSPHL